MKIVTVCQRGCVRSVALKNVIKWVLNMPHRGLNCGWETNDDDTLRLLFDWADLVIVMEPYMTTNLLGRFPGISSKLKCCDVGPDVYGIYNHPVLEAKCIDWAKKNL